MRVDLSLGLNTTAARRAWGSWGRASHQRHDSDLLSHPTCSCATACAAIELCAKLLEPQAAIYSDKDIDAMSAA